MLEVLYCKSLKSTQEYLIESVTSKTLKSPILVYTQNQTQGIGSRGNIWQGIDGNLFFSFVITEDMLAKDLPTSSMSIYFGYIMKEILSAMNSKVYVKWPNDLYLDGKKIGGLITSKKQKYIYVGAGINLVKNTHNLHILDISLDIKRFLKILIKEITSPPLWDRIFKLYEIEFHKSNCEHTATIDGKSAYLKNATLNEDGSIKLNNKKVYSLR